jgi:hypothetical protein
MTEPNEQVAPPWVTAWIAGPPELRNEPDLLVSFADDLSTRLFSALPRDHPGYPV